MKTNKVITLDNRKALVFVYGTLKKGFMNHSLIESSEFLGGGRTEEKYTMHHSFDRKIPFITKEPSYYITGELYNVSTIMFAMLDCLEGHPHWYKRDLIIVNIEGKQYRTWMYFLNDLTQPRVKYDNGTWQNLTTTLEIL